MSDAAESAFRAFRDHGRPRDLARAFDGTAQELLLVAGHLARGTGEAEELVQQTFLTAIEQRARWDAERPLVPWLLGILVRLARSERRQRAEENARGGGGVDALASDAAGPLERAADAELATALAGALAELPDAYREVLSLRLVHGLEAVEIAHALGRPLETVKTQMKRGKERLRDALPRSLAALVALERDGLGEVRRAVLAAAQGTAAGGALAAGMGVGLMGTATAVAAVALACAGALWWMRPGADAGEDSSTAPVQASRGAKPAAPADGEASAASLAPAPVPAREEVAAPPAAEPVTRATARLACRVSFESDGAPAAGVWVALGQRDPPSAPARRADEEGAVVFEDVPPGSALVTTDRGTADFLELDPGDNAAELAIPAGVLVEGRVLDDDGAPLPGAELWLASRYADDGEGWWIGRADGGGRFALRDVRPNTALAARHRGRAPGDAVVVDGAPDGVAGERVEVTLHVGPHGPRLHGVVLDELGAPVPDAHLFAGYASAGDLVRIVRRTFAPPPPQSTVTDERGRFEIDAVPPHGGLPLWIHADGYAVGREEVTPERAGRALEIVLVREARVAGSVHDAHGAALEGAEVGAWSEGSAREPIAPPHWGEARGWTRADGSFEIAGLRAGPAELRASVRALGEARASVLLVAGETTAWDAEIRPAAELAGTVVDERGAPVAGLRVGASCEDLANQPHHLQATATDAAGRFRISGAVCERYTLHLSDEAADVYAPLERTTAVPGTDVEIVFPSRTHASARITGRLVAADGAPLDAERMQLLLLGPNGACSFGGERSRCVGGALEAGPVVPGTYLLRVSCADHEWTVGSFELAAGEVRDIGERAAPAAGRLELELVDAAGTPVPRASFSLWGESDVIGRALEFTDGVCVREAMQPGRYELHSFGRDVPKTRVELEVLPGETTRRTIALPQAFERWLLFPSPTRASVVECMHTWTCDGVELARGRWTFRSLAAGWPASRHMLPAGHHAVTFTADDGTSETTTFDVRAETTAPDLVVEIRAPFQ